MQDAPCCASPCSPRLRAPPSAKSRWPLVNHDGLLWKLGACWPMGTGSEEKSFTRWAGARGSRRNLTPNQSRVLCSRLSGEGPAAAPNPASSPTFSELHAQATWPRRVAPRVPVAVGSSQGLPSSRLHLEARVPQSAGGLGAWVCKELLKIWQALLPAPPLLLT